MGEGSFWRDESQPIFERAKDFLASQGRSVLHSPETPPEPETPPKRKSPQGGRPSTATRHRASPGRHSRKCSVCSHPDREAIEQDYLDWRSPDDIAESYGIAHHSAIYRHVDALGLRGRRNATMRAVLDTIIERVSSVRVTANDVIKAVRASCCLTNDGRWIEPERVIIHQTLTNPNRETEY